MLVYQRVMLNGGDAHEQQQGITLYQLAIDS